MPAIVCSDLSFSWSDGTPVLSALTVSFGPGRTGLVAGHDLPFLRSAGITRWLRLDCAAGSTVIERP